MIFRHPSKSSSTSKFSCFLIMRVHSEEIQCCIFPLQFKDYLCDDALIVEVWGRQKVKKNQMGALNTKELMVRERTGIQSSSVVCVIFSRAVHIRCSKSQNYGRFFIKVSYWKIIMSCSQRRGDKRHTAKVASIYDTRLFQIKATTYTGVIGLKC